MSVAEALRGSRPDPKLRLSAGSLSGLADGAAVATWSDPASGRVATAPMTTARAIYRTAQTPAGTPAVHFQGDDYYEVPDHPELELNGSSTVVVVFAPDVTSTQQSFVSKHSDNATAGAYYGMLLSGGQLGIDRPWKEAGPRSGISKRRFGASRESCLRHCATRRAMRAAVRVFAIKNPPARRIR